MPKADLSPFCLLFWHVCGGPNRLTFICVSFGQLKIPAFWSDCNLRQAYPQVLGVFQATYRRFFTGFKGNLSILWMDEILHHFETMRTHCWYLQGNRTIPGIPRWCEMDFATIHRSSHVLARRMTASRSEFLGVIRADSTWGPGEPKWPKQLGVVCVRVLVVCF